MRAAAFFLLACAAGIGAVAACSSSSSDDNPPPDAGGGDATPPPPPPPPADGGDAGASTTLPSGGSRIAARYLEGSDGSKFFNDLFDKKLNVTCDVLGAEDGSLRCIPRVNANVSERFSDDKCMTPIARRSNTCDTVPYATGGVAASCAGAPLQAVYELGTSPITATFYKDMSGTCMPAAAPDPNEQYLALTRKVAPSELVGFTPHDETLTDALSIHVLVGDDGSRTLMKGAQLVDVARKGPCGPALGGDDGMPRCLPPTNWFAAGFTDMTCSTPAAFGQACSLDGGAPQFAAEDGTSTECDAFTPRKIHTIGALRPTRDWYFGQPGACKGPEQLPYDLVELGAEVPESTFPALSYDTQGGSRLAADTFHAGSLLLDRAPVHDRMYGAACVFQTTKDGVTRCLPVQPTTGFFYSDMTCTTPLANGDAFCATAKYATVADAQCNPKYTVYALGTLADAKTATLYYKAGPSGCVQFTGSPGGKYVWPLAAEVPPTTFVDAKLVEH